MQRVTITLEDDLLKDLDQLSDLRGYQSRSEAIRDLVRAALQQAIMEKGKGNCVAALVYVYDHSARALAQKLTENYHHHHDIALATLHVHLDDETCMEMTALKGPTDDVQHFADHIVAERGVRYGQVVVIPSQHKEHSRKR